MHILTLGEERLVEIGDVINLQTNLQQFSGSGLDIMPAEESTSGADITDFKNITESVGQLYGYHYSENSVALGTRSATNAIDSDIYRIQMAIGLSSNANGEYHCEAKTFVNGTRRIIVNITAITRECSNHVLNQCKYGKSIVENYTLCPK